MTTIATEVSPSKWTIASPTFGPRKDQFSKLTSHNSPIMLQLCASDVALKAPFGVSSFGDENHTRVNLALAVQDESLKTWAHGIDEWAIKELCKDSERLLSNSRLTEAEVRCMYKPLLTEKDNCPPILKMKMNLNHVRCWNSERERVTTEEIDWKQYRFTPMFIVSKMWYMNNCCGLIVPNAETCLMDSLPWGHKSSATQGPPCLVKRRHGVQFDVSGMQSYNRGN